MTLPNPTPPAEPDKASEATEPRKVRRKGASDQQIAQWLKHVPGGSSVITPNNVKLLSMADRICSDAATITALKAKLAEQEEVLSRLPKTADGVPITPGMYVYRAEGSTAIVQCITSSGIGVSRGCLCQEWCADYLYSKLSLAIAAREAALSAAAKETP